VVYLVGSLQVIPWCRYHGKSGQMIPRCLLWYTASGLPGGIRVYQGLLRGTPRVVLPGCCSVRLRFTAVLYCGWFTSSSCVLPSGVYCVPHRVNHT